VGISIYYIADKLDLSFGGFIATIDDHPYSKIFIWDWQSSKYFFKQFFSGAFIAIVMTGLDQNMMQKNLTCKNIGEAKKNMYWFSFILVPANFLFLSLGLLLYMYAAKMGIAIPERTDDLYPILALKHFSPFIGIVFLLGIIAAAFSSADSALTSLTTAFCVDFLKLETLPEKEQKRKRLWVHVGFSVLVFLIIVGFRIINNDSVITAVFVVAGYTYGPLLGMFAFGLFTKRVTKDNAIPYIAVIAPILSYLLSTYSEVLLGGYKFGFELLIVNGMITFAGLWIFSKKGE